jgi:hypothetical protein
VGQGKSGEGRRKTRGANEEVQHSRHSSFCSSVHTLALPMIQMKSQEVTSLDWKPRFLIIIIPPSQLPLFITLFPWFDWVYVFANSVPFIIKSFKCLGEGRVGGY